MIIQRKIKTVAILCFICFFYCLSIQAKAVVVPLVTNKVNRDANFNNSVWKKATTFTKFVSSDGTVPIVKTKLYLMHDKANLYVGFECLDQNPKKLISNSRYLPAGDAVALALDTFHDGLAAYVFAANPNGNKQNGVISDYSHDLRFAFSTNYTVKSKLTPDGYNIEMIIPFKSIPYSMKHEALMSFQAIRIVYSSKEFDYPYIIGDRQGGVLIQAYTIKLQSIPYSHYKKPWFDVNAIYAARKKLSIGYDLNTCIGRAKGWGIVDSSVADYKMFSSHVLYPSKTPKPLAKDMKTKWVEKQFNNIDFYPGRSIGNLEQFLKRTQTTSFIVVHNNKIIYEKYFNGFNKASMAPSFSMAKSFISALIGIAIDKKQIKSINDPITKYLPELLKQDKRFAHIKIKDLLQMSTGIQYMPGAPYYDDSKAYWSPNLRYRLLHTLKIIEPPGYHYHYSDYFAQLAGLVLIRATHQSATQLLQNELWNPLGMQYGGSWSIDSKKDNLEQLAVGINVPAIDYAKFGLLFLHKGKWNNKQIVPSQWVEVSTQTIPKKLGYYPTWNYDNVWDSKIYYAYFWWGLKRPDKRNRKNDFMALGHRGQYIYVSPQKNLVIVRTGIDPGVRLGAWQNIFYDFASKF